MFKIFLSFCLYDFQCILRNKCKKICLSDGVIYEDQIITENLINIIKFLFKRKEDKLYYLISNYDNSISKELIKSKITCFDKLCWWTLEIQFFNIFVFISETGIVIKRKK